MRAPNGATTKNAQPLPWLAAGLVLCTLAGLLVRLPPDGPALAVELVLGDRLELVGALAAGGGAGGGGGGAVVAGGGAGTDET